jgi:hypothetical protein
LVGSVRIEQDCEVAACRCAELLLFLEDVLHNTMSANERVRRSGNAGHVRPYPRQRGNVGVERQALGCRAVAVRHVLFGDASVCLSRGCFCLGTKRGRPVTEIYSGSRGWRSERIG